MVLARFIFVAVLTLLSTNGLKADAVIQLEAPSDTIVLPVGTTTPVDLFVFNDAIDAVNIESLQLSMEILQSGSLASPASSPTFGAVQILDDAGQLFQGTTPIFPNNNDGAGSTQRFFDWLVSSPGAELLGTDPPKAFARIDFDTSNVTAPGTYTLRFEAISMGTSFPTEFRTAAGALSTDISGPIAPPINTGGAVYASELIISVVPEPNAFVSGAFLASFGLIVRKGTQLRMHNRRRSVEA